jgi:hypothetical protein
MADGHRQRRQETVGVTVVVDEDTTSGAWPRE